MREEKTEKKEVKPEDKPLHDTDIRSPFAITSQLEEGSITENALDELNSTAKKKLSETK